MFPAGTEE